MQQQLKSRQTRERILAAAIEMLGSGSYEQFSVSELCSQYQISKGLIYRYYGNKDGLYLSCVQHCFERFGEYMAGLQFRQEGIREKLQEFLQARSHFFAENPCLSRIFLQAALYPPAHLIADIHRERADFDRQSVGICRQILDGAVLRESVEMEDAVDYFAIMEPFFHTLLQNRLPRGDGVRDLLEEHETQLFKWLDIMIYGFIKEEK